MKTIVSTFAIASCLVISGCGEETSTPAEDNKDQDTAAIAQTIANETIITDGHIDVPYRLDHEWEDVTIATETGDFDYPRAVAGGLNAPFMSIYIPADLQTKGGAKELADKLIDDMEKIVTSAPEKFVIAKSVADVENAFAAGKIALPLGIENGAPIEGSMDNLKHFYDRGVRYITLSHSKWNHISDSSYDPDKHWGGLSDFGKELVVEMNNIGIMVDISHVSDDAFWQVMEISKVPAIASHSSARHFTPGFERNMGDEMIKSLAENGGVIMINYGSAFLTEKANGYRGIQKAGYRAMLKEKAIEGSDEIEDAFNAQWRDEHPYPFASLEDVLNHFDHVVKITGSVDYVGIGSDYDGVGDSLPTDLKDVASYPNLIKGLLDRGYSQQDIKKILSGNLLRVWSETERYAAAN